MQIISGQIKRGTYTFNYNELQELVKLSVKARRTRGVKAKKKFGT